MAQSNILEHYLVSLSMKGPSSAERREAEKAFSALAEAVSIVVPAITAAGTAITFATDKIATSLTKLYYEAQKTGSSVRELDAAGRAMVQSGTTMEKFHADYDKFAEKLRKFPQYKEILKKQLGLTDADFKDMQTAHSAYLKAVAERRKVGDMQVGMLELMQTDEDVILARGRATYDPYFAAQMEKNIGLDEQAVKAVALVRALDAFGDSLETLSRKMAAALFDKYGIVLDDMTKWVNDHSDEIVAVVTEVVDQLTLAWKDIAPVAVPAVHLIAVGFDRTAAALDRLLGSPDGQHGGLHAVRYLLDALAVYIAGKWALRLLGLLGLRGIGGAALGVLGLGGGAAVLGAGAAAAGVLGSVPKAEGDDSYGLDHPGWHPGMPKEKTRAQKEGGASDKTPSGATPPPPPPTGTGGNPADFAESLDNLHDHDPAGHAKIMEFLRTGGHGMDPATTSWCAAFVGSALHKAGYKDIPQVKGGDVANAYQNWGVPVAAKDVQRGDVVVTTRGLRPGAMGGHVSLASGPMVDGKIPVIEGDTREDPRYGGRHQVGRDWEQDRPGLMYRRGIPPEPSPEPAPAAPPEPAQKPQSMLQLPADLHSRLAALSGQRQNQNQWSKTNNIGMRKQTTNIHLASTDPHTAASEIARHMTAIHAGTLKAMDRLA